MWRSLQRSHVSYKCSHWNEAFEWWEERLRLRELWPTWIVSWVSFREKLTYVEFFFRVMSIARSPVISSRGSLKRECYGPTVICIAPRRIALMLNYVMYVGIYVRWERNYITHVRTFGRKRYANFRRLFRDQTRFNARNINQVLLLAIDLRSYQQTKLVRLWILLFGILISFIVF